MFSIEAMSLRLALSENVRLEFKKSLSDDTNFVAFFFKWLNGNMYVF